ncbi:MAG: hypothetical protein AB7L90_19170 [Hyphomicrobiaceae bacterium]
MRGVRTGDVAAKLGVSPALISQTIGKLRARYHKLCATGEGLSRPAEKQIQTLNERAAIARGEDPYAKALGRRGGSLLSQLDEPSPKKPEVENEYSHINLDLIDEIEMDD